VGAGTEIAHQRDRTVDHTGNRQVQWAQRAGTRANGGTDFRFRGEYQRAGNLLQVGGLDLVEFVVAAYDEGYQLAFFDAMNDQRFHRFLDGEAELLDEFDDRLGIRCVYQAHFFAWCRTIGFARNGFGLLDVGGVVGGVAERDVVFARLSQYVE